MVTFNFATGTFPQVPNLQGLEKSDEVARGNEKSEQMQLNAADLTNRNFGLNPNSDSEKNGFYGFPFLLPPEGEKKYLINVLVDVSPALLAILGVGVLFASSYYLSSTIFGSSQVTTISHIYRNDLMGNDSSPLLFVANLVGFSALTALAINYFVQPSRPVQNPPRGNLQPNGQAVQPVDPWNINRAAAPVALHVPPVGVGVPDAVDLGELRALREPFMIQVSSAAQNQGGQNPLQPAALAGNQPPQQGPAPDLAELAEFLRNLERNRPSVSSSRPRPFPYNNGNSTGSEFGGHSQYQVGSAYPAPPTHQGFYLGSTEDNQFRDSDDFKSDEESRTPGDPGMPGHYSERNLSQVYYDYDPTTLTVDPSTDPEEVSDSDLRDDQPLVARGDIEEGAPGYEEDN